jgi:hypothetical protein
MSADRAIFEPPSMHLESGKLYEFPQFTVTIKIHKTSPKGKPITGNHKWITQPATRWVTKMVQPYASNLPTAVRKLPRKESKKCHW